jgi:peptide/nickel transport system ATP-binding protein
MSSEPQFEIRDLDVAYTASDGPLLEVRDLRVEYATAAGSVRAVDGVDMEVREGEFVGVVGESGCGKSTLLFAIARLLSPPAAITGGRVAFRGRNLVTMTDKELNALRWREYSVVMQSAMNALNPVTTIGAQFKDAIDAHAKWSVAQTAQRCVEVMKLVGIDPIHLKSYPHQLSGGMRQRAMIAMALLFTPDLVIMDEPTSDSTCRNDTHGSDKGLRQSSVRVIFVTRYVAGEHFSDQLLIVRRPGRRDGPTRAVFDSPSHPYSRGLLDAFPSIRGRASG